MAFAAAAIVCLLLIQCAIPALGYGESDAAGHPSYQERANHVFLNAARIAPSQYKTVYMAGYSPSPASILTSSYPAVAPVYMEPTLVNSAFFHSNDMAVHGCFSHPSCDGTDTFGRVKSYYTCSGTLGENIAAGYADPLDASNQWLCDSTGSACAADKSGSDGHRSNMMSGSYTAVGVGYSYSASATYRHYWTQDFGGKICTAPNSPVYGGSHRVKSGTIKFIAVYYTTPAAAPATASVVIAGASYPLSLDIGEQGRGTYAYSQTAGSACRSYYFQFGNVRYPTTGCLVTYGEGSCTASFDAACSGNGNPSTPSPTTAPAATPSPTSSPTTVPTNSSSEPTVPPTYAPTRNPTAKPTFAATRNPTVKPTSAPTTPPGSVYFVYSSTLQNGWTKYTPNAFTDSFIYSGVPGLSAVLTGSSGKNFVWFDHSPSVTNVWTTVRFGAASSTPVDILVYFNGGYYQKVSLTTTWKYFNLAMDSLGSPASVGTSKQLVFQNSGSSTFTLYLSGVSFV